MWEFVKRSIYLMVCLPSYEDSGSKRFGYSSIQIKYTIFVFLFFSMTKRFFSSLILLVFSGILIWVWQFIFHLPQAQPYITSVFSFFARPRVITAKEQVLTDFDGNISVLIACERSSPDCVQAIPRFTELAKNSSGIYPSWLVVRMVSLSEKVFSQEIPQIRLSAFRDREQFLAFGSGCASVPRYIVRGKTGELLYHSCTSKQSLDDVRKNSIDEKKSTP